MNVAQTVEAQKLVEQSKGKNVFAQAEVTVPKVTQKKTQVREKRTGTKQEKAMEIYLRLDGVRGDVVQAIQADLGMSLAGATTYFYNCKKAAKKAK